MTFLAKLTAEIARSLLNAYSRDNHSVDRFGPLTLRQRLGSVATAAAAKLGVSRRAAADMSTFLETIEPMAERFEWLYGELADAASKDLLIRVLSYRALGFRKVKLPINTEKYREGLERLRARGDRGDTIDMELPGFRVRLERVNLREEGFPIDLYGQALGLFAVFDTLQYEYCANGSVTSAIIQAEEGDVVIDAGGCWGDTALYFAHRAGASGAVHVFEFVPSNLDVFRKNLDLNPELSQRVHIVENALWDTSGETIWFKDSGPASRVAMGTSEGEGRGFDGSCTTVTIDDFVADRQLERVDFIKMDVEGAEPAVLRGARETIARCRPKLAISVYHRLSDFVEVPELIREFAPGYRLYLGHSTIYGEETVLFAVHDS